MNTNSSSALKYSTLYELLFSHSEVSPDKSAILAPGRKPLGYQDLFAIVAGTHGALRRRGSGPRDRVAVVLPNGPEMAVAVAAVAASSVCLPINPSLPDQDWSEHLDRLRAKALLTIPGTSPAAERAAAELGLGVLVLNPKPDIGAGAFELDGLVLAGVANETRPEKHDDAFVLTTSGTSSTPKAVPLTHANILNSANNTIATLGLTRDDRLLSVLPLYHAHGLIAGLMSSLAAAASVICMRGFSAAEFAGQLRDAGPTWYTAVPTIHLAVANELRRDGEALQCHRLRFVRSASAPLPVSQIRDLEDLFGVPVIEAYGLTEAASQAASNPLTPGAQKIGSVGLPTGTEIVILDDNGASKRSSGVGEIALRGPNVTRGYDMANGHTAARAEAGWLRTGDLGYFDDDGYLFVTGRVSDIINRGGEKISPQKVEHVLLEHRDVEQAVAFPIPHRTLGQDVAAAVVLRPGAGATTKDIRSFALESRRLAPSHCPRRVVIVQDIPRTANSKIKRNELAATLGMDRDILATNEPEGVGRASISDTERALLEFWKQVFESEDVGLDTDFFASGGDSISAVELAIAIHERFDVNLPLRTIFEHATIADLAARIDSYTDDAGHLSKHNRIDRSSKFGAPATLSQANIIDLQADLPGIAIFNMTSSYRLKGRFDIATFNRSLKLTIVRNEILRTAFSSLRGQHRLTPASNVNMQVEVEDWRALPADGRADFVNAIAADEVWSVLDMSQFAPFRVRVLRLADDEHAVVLTFHHVITDGWSSRIFLRELFGTYDDLMQGGERSSNGDKLQFSDFARWQHAWTMSPAGGQQLDYWRDKLKSAKPVFGTADIVPGSSHALATSRLPVHFSLDEIGPLKEFCRRQNSTLFIAMLTCFKVALMKRFQCDDLSIAIPMANRSHPDTADILGLIENTVVVRSHHLPDATFKEALRSVTEAVLDAHRHQELPFEYIAEQLEQDCSGSTDALSQIYFAIHDFFEPDSCHPDLEIRRVENTSDQEHVVLPTRSTQLLMLLNETKTGVEGACIFKAEQIKPEDVQGLLDDFHRLLAALVSDPAQIVNHA